MRRKKPVRVIVSNGGMSNLRRGCGGMRGSQRYMDRGVVLMGGQAERMRLRATPRDLPKGFLDGLPESSLLTRMFDKRQERGGFFKRITSTCSGVEGSLCRARMRESSSRARVCVAR